MLDVLITAGEVDDRTGRYREGGANVLSDRPAHPQARLQIRAGHHVREEKMLPLGDATRRLTKASR